MNLIDRIFRKLGYVRIMKEIQIKEEKFEIKMMKMEYELTPTDFINFKNPLLLCAQYEEQRVYDLLRSLTPFIEKRWCQGHDLLRPDVRKYELRIFVAKPKAQDQPT